MSDFKQPIASDALAEITLERMKFAANTVLPFTLIEPNVKVAVDSCVRAYIVKITAEILGCPSGSRTTTIDYPDGWWQAVKQKFFPTWLKRKFPVRVVSHTISLDAKALFPYANMALPDSLGSPKFVIQTNHLTERKT